MLSPEYLFAAVGLTAFVVALIASGWALRRERAGAAPEAKPLRQAAILSPISLWEQLRKAWLSPEEGAEKLPYLEKILLSADVGVEATRLLIERLRSRIGRQQDLEVLRDTLRDEMLRLLRPGGGRELSEAPHVIVVVGVNGVGKTTTIAKLASHYLRQGRTVMMVAADTFRAAAVEQLSYWADKVGVDCIRQATGADPSAVAFDGMSAARARHVDIVIVDTAGRLHVKANLVSELQRLVRTVGRVIPGAPHEVLLVLDAAVGQNGLVQARVFREALPLSGVVLTKLDGTGKGGVALAIHAQLDLPIAYVAFGEDLGDLSPFDPQAFVDAIVPPTGSKAS